MSSSSSTTFSSRSRSESSDDSTMEKPKLTAAQEKAAKAARHNEKHETEAPKITKQQLVTQKLAEKAAAKAAAKVVAPKETKEEKEAKKLAQQKIARRLAKMQSGGMPLDWRDMSAAERLREGHARQCENEVNAKYI